MILAVLSSWVVWIALVIVFSRWKRRLLALRPASPADAESRLFAEDYLHSLDELRAAISTAHFENRPGAASADLDECWSIWHTTPEDDPT
ncbi:hypothetical protein CP980_34920 [Streptomyces vinaceus]|uniref:Uncharacterized protein n=1 Tax=Streptomyces vinaceus TaxID=1960 RepID=A0A5J6JI74_STRVI|nr:hypothetical protein [Streptomyces vinaceus]QEV49521.1 hypothetical protein CP980_34920 [Streptomyces vinaceus]GHE46393.1 hypothetical protein GCM10017778_32900 [Streptomyces vinaceus]